MNLSTATAALDYLVGRRFEFHDDNGKRADVTDITFVGGDPERGRIRAHALDGRREGFALDAVIGAVRIGVLVESERGVPFVLARETKFDRMRQARAARRGVAGRGKALLRLVPGTGRWEKF